MRVQVCSDAALAAALSQAAEPPPGGSRPTPSRAARSVAMQFGKVCFPWSFADGQQCSKPLPHG